MKILEMAKIPLGEVPDRPAPQSCPNHPDVLNEAFIIIPRGEDSEVQWEFRNGCDQCDREKRRRESIKRIIGHSGIAPKYADLTWDSFITEQAALKKMKRPHTAADCKKMGQLKAWLMTWVENWKETAQSGSSWVFSGPPGNGKTHLSATVGLEVIRSAMVQPVFTSLSDLFMEIKSTFKRGGRSEMDKMKEIVRIPLLIMDEVGLHTDTDWAFEKLSYIIHERINHQKPSIYITNMGEQKWPEAFGDRITDRFLDDSVFRVVAFSWPSFRTGKKR